MPLIFHNPQVLTEYERCRLRLSHEQYFVVNEGLGVSDALMAHFLIADYFVSKREGIGGIGPKSDSLLISAISRQFVEYGKKRKWTDRFDIAASLMYGMIKNHPFYDANKRTAFLCCLYFLQQEKRVPSVPHIEFEDFTVEIAEDALPKYFNDCGILPDSEDKEIQAISWFLRRKTRGIQTAFINITYNDLRRILNGFGFDTIHPRNNFIDIIRLENGQRVCQVGFPGWKNEVDRNALKHVRSYCGLSLKDGFDNQAFYNGESDLTSLIEQYAEPLRNLAVR